ncbi:MAG: dipeptidyl peptidase IV N-terminal region-domain-containing protein [Benjaminiella poitrasii]|nr:MAG: dipeptidyl peptidase IV N-terminal region-domain-containing protein [Benjaminiella poitrasii]
MGPHRDYFLDDEESGNASQKQSLLNSNHKNKVEQQRSSTHSDDDTDSYIYSEEEKDDLMDAYSSNSQKKGFNWICVSFLSILALAWILWSLSIAQLFSKLTSSEQQLTDLDGSKAIQFDDIFNSSFAIKRKNLVWVENDPKDGIYTYRDAQSNDILLESIEDRKSHVFVQAKDLQWRHSALFNAYIYHLSDKNVTPLITNATLTSSKISYAAWSPTGHQLAYVLNNDIYITDLSKNTRITFDGSATVFNGIPDWVYEEEVLGTNFALWWAPDSSYLAFLRLDETNVPEYHLQMYTTTKLNNTAYPKENKIRYPKAGSPNPLVSLHIYSLSKDRILTATDSKDNHALNNHYVNSVQKNKGFKEEDRLIVDVTWATSKDNVQLLYKQMNRIQDHQLTFVVHIDEGLLENSTAELIREYKPSDGGWIDVAQSMVYLPFAAVNGSNAQEDQVLLRYLDILDNEDGFAHLAIITVTNSDKGQGLKHRIAWLTTGDWEVISETVNVDAERQLVHFISTERSPYERHLYKLSFKHKEPATIKTCITCPKDPKEHAYYSATFSPKLGYYILNYEGPDIPSTIVKKVDDPSFKVVLENNDKLRSLLKEYELPKTRMKTIPSGDIEMTAIEIVPFDFDSRKKYPVLFHVYGGPGSQLVSYKFDLSWQTFVASQLGFIVVTVDGRGTGFRGRKYRSGVRERLGELETIDQVNAGRHWAKLSYVDEYRMAIWGWSYGGYMTSKVIEANDGVFSTGMAVAPVTDWHFYGIK